MPGYRLYNSIIISINDLQFSPDIPPGEHEVSNEDTLDSRDSIEDCSFSRSSSMRLILF